MTEELLRIQNGYYLKDQILYLKDFELTLTKSSFVGLYPTGRHGLPELKQIFIDEEVMSRGNLYWEGQATDIFERGCIAWVESTTHLLTEISLYDLFFVMKKVKPFLIHDSRLKINAQVILDKYQVRGKSSDFIDDLCPVSRIKVEIIARFLHGHRLIVLNDIEEILAPSEITEVLALCRRLQTEGVAFLYIGTSMERLLSKMDRLLLMDKGKIIRMVEKNDFPHYLNPHGHVKSTPIHCYPVKSLQPPLVRLPGLPYLWQQDVALSLHQGECHALVCPTLSSMDEFIQYFNGSPIFRQRMTGIKFQLLPESPIQTTLFNGQSVLFNLLLTIEQKLKQKFFTKQFLKSLQQEFPAFLFQTIDCQDIDELDICELYNLIFLKILIANPGLVVMVRPLISKDIRFQNHLLMLISLLKQYRIAVIVLSLSQDNWYKVADDLIEVKEPKDVCALEN
ncbi:MAG: hypothetical protein FWF59_08945 [Turicibacter sp.]|nr:hypothetical protein [Turicibacter sp.]